MPHARLARRRSARSAAAAAFCSALIFLSGCSGGTEAPEPRHRFSLDELTVHAGDTLRSFFLSDRRGGFLTGRAGARMPFNPSWSVDGEKILRTIEVTVEDTLLGAATVRGVEVRPDRVEMDFEGGRVVWAPLEGLRERLWGISVNVQTDRDVRVSLRLIPGNGFTAGGGGGMVWRGAGGMVLTFFGGREVRGGARVFGPGEGRDHRAMVLLSRGRISADELASLHSRLAERAARRAGRMEQLLERSYLRVSDSLMTRALAWARLSVDAMIVERAETLAVSSLPWDGSYDGRANLQSLAGLVLTSGEYSTAASMLRGWGATQDVAGGRTFGRIASRLHGSPPEYRGVDVGAWFVRGLYEYIVASGDTASVGRLFPVVCRGIDGMLRNNVSGKNLVVHRGDETWMGESRFDGSPAPYAAVEVQALWQYQQMIGGMFAQLRSDSVLAAEWSRGAAGTAAEFARAFVDTGRSIVYDYLDGEGRGVDVLRPNGMLALDAIEGERIQQALLKRSVRGLLYPQGPGTLEMTRRGVLSVSAGGRSQFADGAVVPWLVGPFAYGLTRADRQDLAYRMSRSVAERALGRGMVGGIPEVLPPADTEREEGGECEYRASLLGASEFLRSMYQDFLGIRVDVPSSVIRCEPKLPAEVRSADFTVYMGEHAVSGSYRKVGRTGRMSLSLSEVPRTVKWRFIWVFESGDAWLGAVHLRPGSSATAVFAPDGILVYQDGKERKPDESWFVKGFDRSGELGDLSMAEPGSRP